jgi:hypothetical protein
MIGPYAPPVLAGVALCALVWCALLISSAGVAVNRHNKGKGPGR